MNVQWREISNDVKKRQANLSNKMLQNCFDFLLYRGRRGRDRVVVGFITTYAISVYHH